MKILDEMCPACGEHLYLDEKEEIIVTNPADTEEAKQAVILQCISCWTIIHMPKDLATKKGIEKY